jgi:plastocyanin
VETPDATETPGETETPATSACQPGDPAAANVFISGFAFGPPVTTVPVGGTITWLNQDAVGHTATADDGTFDCRPLGSSASLSFTFTTPGVVDYHCAIHPTMRGQIHVVE